MSLIDGERLRRFLNEKKDYLQAARDKAAVDDNASLGFKLAGAVQTIELILKELPGYTVNLGGPSPHNVRRDDPEEAQQAASNTFGRSKNRVRVYAALQALREGTAEEIAAKAIEMFPGVYPPYSLARRVTDLHERGLIEKTGERRTTQAGGSADVWRLIPETAGEQ